MLDPVIRGFVAIAGSSGALLAVLSLWHQSGVWPSVGLGFVAALLVGLGLALLYGVLWAIPGALAGAMVIGSHWAMSVAAGVVIAVLAIFVGMLVSDSSRAFDFGLFVPVAVLYGAVGGLAFKLAVAR